MPQLPFDWSPGGKKPVDRPEPMTVSQLGDAISTALASGTPDPAHVVGEIGSYTVRNGHRYFALRDPEADALVSCVMWASDARRSPVEPAVGDRVVVTATVVHWAPQGKTQLRVRAISPVGEGALQAAFEKRCAQLRALGWFDPATKSRLPRVPRRVAVLTSAAGAAIHDVRAQVALRFPPCALVLVDVPVQGEGAAAVIASRLGELDAKASRHRIDAIVVTRGGGSAEDLQAFNTLEVAAAIHDAVTPVVAAIGHESDTTIAELVADARASTPTAAIALLLPDVRQERQRVGMLGEDLRRRMRRRLDHAAGVCDGLGRDSRHGVSGILARARASTEAAATALAQCQPRVRLVKRQAALEALAIRLGQAARAVVHRPSPVAWAERLSRAARHRLERAGVRVTRCHGVLEALGPDQVLSRGYSITTGSDGSIVRRASDVQVGDRLDTRTAHGVIPSVVTDP